MSEAGTGKSPLIDSVSSVRLDKWLHVARAFKTRSQATKACANGRVRVNDQIAKAHRSVAIGDRIEVELKDWTRILIVKILRDKTLPKALVPEIFEDQSPPRPKLDAIDRAMLRGPEKRERGLGRPTKRDRRRQTRLKGRG
ncbi:MAG: S4 domain-containing protein [Acidobacteriota bacterium]